jgi:hypothetical protein
MELSLLDILENIDKEILINCVLRMQSTTSSILVFYSKSADKKPGYGSGESLDPNDDFTELSKIKNWRKILSNFHYDPFIWNNKKWSCIEEAFQAAKFGPENYDSFQKAVRKNSLNLEEDCGMVSQKLRKWRILNGLQLDNWNKNSRKIMKSISEAKYKTSDIAKKAANC